MACIMTGYAGSSTVVVQLEAAFDSTQADWVPLPVAQAALSGNGIVVAPPAGSIAYPARLLRANVLLWPSTVTGGALTAWVGSY